jgi:hypothetical protein
MSEQADTVIGRIHILLSEALRCLEDGNHVAVRRKVAYADVLLDELRPARKPSDPGAP